MTQTAISQSHKLKRMRWAARIISFLPGAGIILFYWGWGLKPFITKGLEPFGLLFDGLAVGLPFLIFAGVAWRWPIVGGILQIACAIYLFNLLISKAGYAPEALLPIASLLLIGGILHLIVSLWGRKLQHKAVIQRL